MRKGWHLANDNRHDDDNDTSLDNAVRQLAARRRTLTKIGDHHGLSLSLIGCTEMSATEAAATETWRARSFDFGDWKIGQIVEVPKAQFDIQPEVPNHGEDSFNNNKKIRAAKGVRAYP